MTNAVLPWYHPLVKAVRAGAFLLAHALIAVVLIGLLTLVSKVVEYTGDHRLFGRVPISFIFDVMDCAILLVFVVFGVIEAVEAFRGSADGHKNGARSGQGGSTSGSGAPQVGAGGAGPTAP